ncbi:hypothetical protein BCR36DRAFT_581267 [Piromyces finnis]|uniref:Uncharacterized protein n=1 Tax=Piromyces finnis TaxID=1754191 RepID=A0A1Y1VII0_9FUNG|nr:hypothetical protein BCR36DRAFT_581267 [Piromyces finnis]|eukprot:ORX56133.1 hypothetical protein BCR36DRAFT_581267 [Piromyces finnis]
MTSTWTSPISLKKQRKDTYFSSYLARKKRSYEEETFEILTDNYRKNKRFITEIMVEQFSLLAVSKNDKITRSKHLFQETTNKINYGEHRFRRKLPKIKTFHTVLNSPLSQPPIIISFSKGDNQDNSDLMLSPLEGNTKTTINHQVEDDDSMSDVPLTPTQTLETSMEECI